MTYTITIKNDQTGSELWRRYDWDIDSDFTVKGEAVEDMMETLDSKEAWSHVEPEHQGEQVDYPDANNSYEPH